MLAPRRISTEVKVGGRERRRAGYFDVWQDDAVEKLRRKRLWALSAPTGSGKSAVQVALLSMYPGKSLLCAPQSLIVGSLARPIDLRLRSGERVAWAPTLTVVECEQTVEQVVEFLRREATGSSTCVCTTATLAAVYKKLRAAGEETLLRDVGVSFDEAHHAENDLRDRNLLGEMIEWLVRHGRGPVGASTATWFRSNLNEILPERDSWTWYRYSMQAYLGGMRHLRDVTLSFLVGTPEEALAEMLSKGVHRTIVHVPPPGTRYGTGTKDEQLQRLLRVCGPFEEEHPFRVHRRMVGGKIVTLRSSDLVTIDGRDGVSGRKRAHIESVVQGKSTGRASENTGTPGTLPDVIFALYLGLEGYDDPSLQRGLMIGARNSSVMRLQALGRLLRDVPGKTWVDFTITVPPLDDKEQARDYMTEIVAVLADMDWRIRPSLLEYDVRSDEELTERFNMEQAARETLGEILRQPAMARGDLDALVASVLRSQHIDDERWYVSEVLSRLQRIARSVSASDLPGVFLDEGVLGALERLSTTLTQQSLLQMRAACGYDLDLSLAEIRAAVRQFHEESGRWPNYRTSDPVPGLDGVSWLQLHGAACRQDSSLDVAVDTVREKGAHYRRRVSG
jgi:hypothetical protein